MATNENKNLAQYEPAFVPLGVGYYSYAGTPTFTAKKGSLCVNTSATGTTDRLFVNTDGSTTWAYFTSSA